MGELDRVVVRVQPLGVEVPVDAGQSLMAAAEAMGLRWPTVCGGDAECGTCFVEVSEEQTDLLPLVTEKEVGGLEMVPGWKRRQAGVVVRLACQLRPSHGLTVQKKGVVWRRVEAAG